MLYSWLYVNFLSKIEISKDIITKELVVNDNVVRGGGQDFLVLEKIQTLYLC